MVKKLSFLHDYIETNDEHVLLIIEDKWFEAIVHMIEFEFLDLHHPKQVQPFISIHIHGKFHLSTTFTLVGFEKDIYKFISQIEISLKGEAFVAPSAIIPIDNI
jgi:hypothetical protein